MIENRILKRLEMACNGILHTIANNTSTITSLTVVVVVVVVPQRSRFESTILISVFVSSCGSLFAITFFFIIIRFRICASSLCVWVLVRVVFFPRDGGNVLCLTIILISLCYLTWYCSKSCHF